MSRMSSNSASRPINSETCSGRFVRAVDSCSQSPDMFWNGKTAIDGLSDKAAKVSGMGFSSATTRKTWTGWPMLAEIGDRKIELTADLRQNRARDAAVGLGHRFEPRGNVEPSP